jgi:CMP-N,N'-diacetyllegionaminic acid synthase
VKPIVIIPARGGSKGVPGKNIRLLAGKPLIHYTIEQARKLFPDEYIVVSTDDKKIINVVEQLGLKVPFMRPAELATDAAGTYEVLLHAIQFVELNGYEPDTLILLQPTSPFRTAHHVEEALKYFDSSCEMLVSVKETSANPYYVLFEEDQNGLLQRSKAGSYTRRQDCPKVWELNGAIYIIRVETLKRKKMGDFSLLKKYVMGAAFSHDIDTELDWVIAEALIRSPMLSKS